MPAQSKYRLYEQSVQTPDAHIEMFQDFYRDLHGGRYARQLREDFCGTFALSCEWVRRNRRNKAICLDLDREPLAYGRRVHLARLDREQKSRIEPRRMDVCSTTKPAADLIVACNFSFNVFKERRKLLEYLRFARRSLKKDGMLILEASGGPGMIEKTRERKAIFGKGRKRLFSYVWDQKEFNPITGEGKYAIHFEMPDGKSKRNAFTYDWRIWSVPELTDLLIDAGFRQSHTYWETTHRGRGTNEYARTRRGDNAYAYIAYVVGIGR